MTPVPVQVRPVVETGYENVLLVRLLLELKSPQLRTSCVPEGLDVGSILSGWEGLKPLLMEAWQQDKEELVHLFGDLRDQWMASDMHGWIHANRWGHHTLTPCVKTEGPLFLS